MPNISTIICQLTPYNKPDFDPHAHSPVEILHVMLLGVVKYFWHDACSRASNDQKALLKARLSSVTVDGLGISPLCGHTLVHHAKSLVGRDFHVIIQLAPAVLYGIIPDPAYEAWLALARLAPLVFKNEIKDLQTYKVQSTDPSAMYGHWPQS